MRSTRGTAGSNLLYCGRLKRRVALLSSEGLPLKASEGGIPVASWAIVLNGPLSIGTVKDVQSQMKLPIDLNREPDEP